MSKVSIKIPDLHALEKTKKVFSMAVEKRCSVFQSCTKKDLTFAINVLATELKRKLDAEKSKHWDVKP